MNTTALSISGVVLSTLLFTACHTPRQNSMGSEIILFNGKDLSGWTFVSANPQAKMESTWRVKDGLLVCTGEPVGFVRTDRAFTNFRMAVDYRWAPGKPAGNSGVFSRINGLPRALPRCVEAQLQHKNAGDILTLQGMELASGQERFFEVKNHELGGHIRGVKKTQDAEKKPGEWNHLEILAQNSSYIVWMNGEKVNTASGIEFVAGPVGLQSEGGEVQFRRVAITPLP